MYEWQSIIDENIITYSHYNDKRYNIGNRLFLFFAGNRYFFEDKAESYIWSSTAIDEIRAFALAIPIFVRDEEDGIYVTKTHKSRIASVYCIKKLPNE